MTSTKMIQSARDILHSQKKIRELYNKAQSQGGLTVDLQGNEPTEGYAYSPFKSFEVSVPKEEFSPKHIDDFIERNHKRLSKPGNHFGLWEEGGKWYMDISQVGEPTFETYRRAFDKHQEAIYNIKTGETYYTPHSPNYGTKIDSTNPYAGQIQGGYKKARASSNAPQASPPLSQEPFIVPAETAVTRALKPKGGNDG